MLTYLLWGQRLGHTVSLSDTHASTSLGDTRQNHWTMKYRSHRPTFILRSYIGSYWPIIPKYDVHTSNNLQDVTQNHWTIKYRSQWPIFILMSNFALYWLINELMAMKQTFQVPIIPNNDVHTSNSLKDIRQNHCTKKYGSQWPTFVFR